MKKTISILGSTGSIGLSALKVVEVKRKLFNVNILLANKNLKLIIQQIKKYRPKYFVVGDYSVFLKINKKYKFKYCKILNKLDYECLKKKNDITISAIPGIAGLKPTLEFIKISKKLLIANKESIVCGWDLIKKKAKKNRTKIIPIDSEHYSLYKLLKKNNIKDIKKLYITASGGPFLNYKLNKFKNITPAQALNHPKWKMGKKISIDSATLMNKILEIIEAQRLFNIPKNKLDILIHPNSLVHAIAELKNGLFEFIYHETSMIIPISNAIFDGNLTINDFYKKKNKIDETNLIFKKVDKKRYPLIKLKNIINQNSSFPIIINASNELVVDEFLKGKIPFLAIPKIIMSVLKDRNFKKNNILNHSKLNQIIRIDKITRVVTTLKIKKFYA